MAGGGGNKERYSKMNKRALKEGTDREDADDKSNCVRYYNMREKRREKIRESRIHLLDAR